MSLYIHIPYCEARCHYCDFNTYAGRVGEREAYVDALVADLRASASRSEGLAVPLATVFVGGGTPGALGAGLLARVLREVQQSYGLAPGAEVSMEANPNSLTAEMLEALMPLGLNRVSLGVQSFDDGELRSLGRVHTSAQARDAVALVRAAGIPSVGLDLIYGLPGQSLEDWRRNLDTALGLAPDHLSLYGLTLEEGTPFGQAWARGDLTVPDDDAQADMYDLACRAASSAGLPQYEISNFARPGHACRHNQVYWENGTYLGVGAGAVSYLGGWRWTRSRRPEVYIRQVRAGAHLFEEGEWLSDAGHLAETLILALRTLPGAIMADVAARFPAVVRDEAHLEAMVVGLTLDLLEGGLCRLEEGRFFLSDAGRAVANGVMERLLGLPACLDKAGPTW